MPRSLTSSESRLDRTFKRRSWVGNIVRRGADFLYPPHCMFCLTPLEEQRENLNHLCKNCRADLLSEAGAACEKCGAPVGPHVDLTAGCNFCLREKFAFERVIRLGVYQETLRQACLRAKRARQEPLACCLANLQWEHRLHAFQDTPIDIVIPIPQYWLQRLYRLHNPAETLAGVWANSLKARKSSHILLKAKWTQPQRSLPASKRRQNVQRAFKVVRAEEIKDATVLLVDDIMTTGATANEAARVLKRAGAKQIITAIVARAIRVQ